MLRLQLPNARWLDQPGPCPVSYLELDALYALKFAGNLAPQHRAGEICAAVRRFAAHVGHSWHTDRATLLAGHPHILLGLVGTFGLLQQHLPGDFADSVRWTDIFSDRRLYQTDAATVQRP